MEMFILFSADYELFLGENFLSEKEVLIHPTEDLLSGCQEDGIPVTLFADVASVWRYRSLGIKSDYPLLFEDQLRRAVRSIHDVQLHMHPHWLTSDYDGNEWRMDTSKFKLCDVGFKDRKNNQKLYAEDLIREGKSYLENLLQQEKTDYACIAFRAGGYGIQPEDKKLFNALLSEGFRIDSSITHGLIYKSNVNQIDFSGLPKKLNCRFGPVHGISREDEQGIFEIPIAGFRECFSETMRRRINNLPSEIGDIWKRYIRHHCGEHKPRGRGIQNDSLFVKLLRRTIYPSQFELELSGYPVDLDRMIDGTRRFVELYCNGCDKVFFSALCHPKELFPLNIRAIREYWARIKGIYGNSIKAVTFKQAADLIKGVSAWEN